jgi:hypothetical protein
MPIFLQLVAEACWSAFVELMDLAVREESQHLRHLKDKKHLDRALI